MNFFKSVFSDDTDPSKPDSDSDSPRSREQQEDEQNPDPDSSSPVKSTDNPNPIGSGWSFGGLMKTLATKSESVIETYRRDLEEFGSGLKKEIEVAQGSLETVGHVIDEIGSSVLKGTAEIIVQGKEAILGDDHESDSSDGNSSKKHGARSSSFSSKQYSRFDMAVRAVQSDASTYCEEPEDLEDYGKWKLGFVLNDKNEEVDRLFEENSNMGSLYKRVVPDSVDHETFWSRYFYKVYKLKLAEDMRANLVKRAISREEEEELSWDVDDDDDEEDEDEDDNNVDENDNDDAHDNKVEVSQMKENEEIVNKSPVKSEKESSEKKDLGEKVEEAAKVESSIKNDKVDKKVEVDKENSETGSPGKLGKEESSKGSEFSEISVQEEEDMGWDEIEDMSTIDEKKLTTTGSGSPNIADLRKRLSVAEEDEDLSWDIEEEDDDEPTKA